MGEIKAATALAHSVTQAAIASADITGIAVERPGGPEQGRAGGDDPAGPEGAAGQDQPVHAHDQAAQARGPGQDQHQAASRRGVDGGLPAAQRLLSEGPKAVKESARLQKEIIKAARGLGVTGANAAYESGPARSARAWPPGCGPSSSPSRRDGEIARPLIASCARSWACRRCKGGVGGGLAAGAAGAVPVITAPATPAARRTCRCSPAAAT